MPRDLNLTVGQKWKFKRNCAIYQLHLDGWSQRLISEVFDLVRSQVAAIIATMRADAEQTDREQFDRASEVASRPGLCLPAKYGRRRSDRV